MSATVQRRDIFDPVHRFRIRGEAWARFERLQRLTLLTYADIHAVNPEALTPWKAEMLWQLFVATSNHFSRTLDRNRLHASDEKSVLEQVRMLAVDSKTADIERFLEGFPRRYLAVHSAAEIARHFAIVSKAKRFIAPDRMTPELAWIFAYIAHSGSAGALFHEFPALSPPGA